MNIVMGVEGKRSDLVLRRIKLLRALSEASAQSEVGHACRAFTAALTERGGEILFALVYLSLPSAATATLAAAAGLSAKTPAPAELPLVEQEPWPIGRALTARQAVMLDVQTRPLLARAGDVLPDRVIAAPLVDTGDDAPAGALIVGFAASAQEHDLDFTAALAAMLAREIKMARLATTVASLQLEQEHTRRSEERYRALVAATASIIWTADSKGAFVTPQHSWQQYTGQGWLMHRGGGWAEAFHPQDRDRIRAAWSGAVAARAPFESEGRIWHAAAGEYREFVARAVPLFEPDGSVREWIGTMTDVAHARRVEQELARSLEREQSVRANAEEANRLKDEFLANVSHELRAPLNAISGWVHLLRLGKLDEERARRALDAIERSTRAQGQIINDLLDVSRIVSGVLRLDRRAVQLDEIIGAAAELVRPTANAKGVRLEESLDPRAGPVSGDPERLRQIFWNLLNNAVKFTPPDGSVRVEARRRDGVAEVIVHDTGRGISAEFLPHVFDRFRQADGTIQRKHGGLGLGLTIVRHLVEMHGGQVRAHSAGENRGATFVVLLPISGSGEAESVPRVEHAQREGIAGVRVLVVDDDDDAREIALALLRAASADVRVAASAPEALAMLDVWRPDVLLSDIGMPGQDGYALIRAIRQRPAERGGQIAAAALTAFTRTEDRLRALSAGYQAHLSKPIEPDDLIGAVFRLTHS